MRKSKYLQSCIGDCYTQVKKILDEVKYYYPFKDEDERVAHLLVQGIKHAYIDEKAPAYYFNDARVCSTLPFTEAEYLAYKNLTDKNKRLILPQNT